nr:tyrosine-type recombinase/integrase [Bifidobacterium ramosum]
MVAGASPAEVATKDLVRALGRCSSREYKKGVKNSFSSFFKWYSRIEQGREDNPAEALPSIRKPKPKPTPCPDSAIRDALQRATASERLMILLAAECGLRRAEIAQVHSRDVVADSSGGKSLIVHGKGDKQRIIPLPGDVAAAIIASRGYVFPGRFGGHVEVSYIGKHISRLLPDGYTAHKLRHRFATVAYSESHDMLGVSKALGHASTETTMAYTALPDGRLRGLVNAATMTEQPSTPEPPKPAPPKPAPGASPVEDTTAQVRRHRNGKIHYGYENGHGDRRKAPRKTASSSVEVERASGIIAGILVSMLQGEIGPLVDMVRGDDPLSFHIPAEAFVETWHIPRTGMHGEAARHGPGHGCCSREAS